jgi:hypothetical protein
MDKAVALEGVGSWRERRWTEVVSGQVEVASEGIGQVAAQGVSTRKVDRRAYVEEHKIPHWMV